MEDVPQPSAEPYLAGDRFRAYIGLDVFDARFYGRVYEVFDVHTDGLER